MIARNPLHPMKRLWKAFKRFALICNRHWLPQIPDTNEVDQFLKEERDDENREYWRDNDPRMYGFVGRGRKGKR